MNEFVEDDPMPDPTLLALYDRRNEARDRLEGRLSQYKSSVGGCTGLLNTRVALGQARKLTLDRRTLTMLEVLDDWLQAEAALGLYEVRHGQE